MHERAPQGQRRDIQGLRAFAVVVVVLNHVWHRPEGGFVGVDIFFVLSGFLITGLLLREHARTGRVAFVRFYARRIKRLVPAAALVLLATTIVGWAMLVPARSTTIFWDAIWSFTFLANWNFAGKGTDYFQLNDAISPLQHFWSLSVEEQFYLVWPWLLILLLGLFASGAKHTPGQIRRVALGAILSLTLASFVWALFQSITSPTIAYFSTFTRAWEIGIGAILAVIAPSFQKLRTATRVVLIYLGLAGMVVSVLVLNPLTTWPAPWALVPTLATAAVIVSGIGREAPFAWPLQNRFSVYVGNLSYSLYLWHFPVIIYGKMLFPDAGFVGNLLILATACALAVVAYHLVEKPIHTSPLWTGQEQSWTQWASTARRPANRAAIGAVAVLICTAVVVTYVPYNTVPVPPTSAASEEVVAATQQATWGAELTPSLSLAAAETYASPWRDDECLAFQGRDASNWDSLAKRCVYGPSTAERTLVILGDSIAISWVPTIITALPHWRIHVLTASQCPASDLKVVKAGREPFPDCELFRVWTHEQVASLSPDAVVLSEAANTLGRLESGQFQAEAIAEGVSGTVSAVEALRPLTRDVVLLTSPPTTLPLADCFNAWRGPDLCLQTPKADYPSLRSSFSQAAELSGADLIDTDALFCVEGVCPMIVADFVTRPDGLHLSDAYARHLSVALRPLLREIGVE